MYYCPSCGEELENSSVLTCQSCDAIFGPGSAWKPASTPPEPQIEGWAVFRSFIGTLLLLAGYGTLILFVLFLIFLFSKGTSSGSVLGLMLAAPPLSGAIVIAIILGHLIKPRKKSKNASD